MKNGGKKDEKEGGKNPSLFAQEIGSRPYFISIIIVKTKTKYGRLHMEEKS